MSFQIFRCDICHQIFKSKYSLADHLRGKHNIGRPIKCGECGMSFSSRSSLWAHSKRNCTLNAGNVD